MEELYDSNTNARGDRDELKVISANGEDEAGGVESTEVSKSTTETLMAGERIMEALDLSAHDRALTTAYEEEIAGHDPKMAAKVGAPTRNAVFQMYGGVGPEEYVLKVVRQIPAASLHDALLVLPFGKVTQLIEHLDYWAHKVRRGYSLPSDAAVMADLRRHRSQEWQITLTSRVLFFLLRTHHSQIVATRALRQTMISLRAHLRDALKRQKVCLATPECHSPGQADRCTPRTRTRSATISLL